MENLDNLSKKCTRCRNNYNANFYYKKQNSKLFSWCKFCTDEHRVKYRRRLEQKHEKKKAELRANLNGLLEKYKDIITQSQIRDIMGLQQAIDEMGLPQILD